MKVVGIEHVIGFPFSILKLRGAWHTNHSEHGADQGGIAMLLPAGVSKPSQHRLAQARVMGLPNKIQQVSESQAGGVRRDFRQIIFNAAVRLMELEDNFIAARNVRSKEAVTGLSPGRMSVESQALAE